MQGVVKVIAKARVVVVEELKLNLKPPKIRVVEITMI